MIDPILGKVRLLVEINQDIEELERHIDEKRETIKYIKEECKKCEAVKDLKGEMNLIRGNIRTLRKSSVELGKKLLEMVREIEQNAKKMDQCSGDEYESIFKNERSKERENVVRIIKQLDEWKLDQTHMVIFGFYNCLGITRRDGCINGVIKYTKEEDLEDYILAANIDAIETIAFRSPVFIVLDEKISKEKMRQILKEKEIRSWVNIVERNVNIDEILESYKIKKIHMIHCDYDVNDATIQKEVIECDLMDDMKRELLINLGDSGSDTIEMLITNNTKKIRMYDSFKK